jgi:hypothetical protein
MADTKGSAIGSGSPPEALTHSESSDMTSSDELSPMNSDDKLQQPHPQFGLSNKFKLSVIRTAPDIASGPFHSNSPLAKSSDRLSAWKTNQDATGPAMVTRFGNPFIALRAQDSAPPSILSMAPLVPPEPGIEKNNAVRRMDASAAPAVPRLVSPKAVELADAHISTKAGEPPLPPAPNDANVVTLTDLLTTLPDDSQNRIRSSSDFTSVMIFGIELGQTEDIMSPYFNVLLVRDQAALKQVACHIIFAVTGPHVAMSKNCMKEYVHEVSVHYRPNPFHNFHHAVSVLHFLAVMLNTTHAAKVMSETMIYAFLLSALVHDVDHPGKTNLFEINSGSPLAMLYNDSSVLENHHCSMGFGLMEKPGMNVLTRLPAEQRKEVRKAMIACILATDMSKHSDLIEEAVLQPPLLSQPLDFSQQIFMGKIFLHAADLSGPCKVFTVAREWASRVTAEFNAQVVVEQEMGLPVLSFMAAADEKTFLKNEIGFSGFFVAPLWRIVSKLCPELGFVHQQLEENINQYKSLKEEQEKEEYDHPPNLA